MDVILFDSFKKKTNSTKRPTLSDGDEFHCKLKESCSMLSPTIILDIGTTDSPYSYTYAYIDDFKRFYFINDWTFNGPTWIATMTVDVLATYKSDILNSTLYVLRAADDYDGDIYDDAYPVKATLLPGSPARSLAPNSVDISSKRGTYTESNFWQLSELTGFYIIAVTGANSVKYYGMTGSVFFQLIKDLLNYVPQDFSDVSDGIAKSIAKPIQYIANAYWLPITSVPLFSTYAQSQKIKFGWYEMGPYYCMELDAQHDSLTIRFTLDVPKHPYSDDRGNYLNMQPFTIYNLDYLPFGTFCLNNVDISLTDTLACAVELDMPTGKGELYVSTESGKILLTHAASLYGVPIPIAQATNDLFSSISSVLGGGIGAVVGISTGDVVGAVTSAATGIASAVKSFLPNINSVGSQGSLVGFARHIPQLWTKCYDIVDEDNAHNGRPLCQDVQILTLDGYILCRDGDINLDCTPEERSEISNYLTGGFFNE